MGDVIDLSKFRVQVDLEEMRKLYREKIATYPHISLLEEMVKFQEARSRLPELNARYMIEGEELFARLEQTANTPELRTLASSYRRHCAAEFQFFLAKKKLDK